MRINKGTYLIICLLLACATGMAQMTVPYNMSPIAVSSGNFTANGGNPIVNDGKSKCLNVSSGLNTMTAASTGGRGAFGGSCVEVTPVASVLISFKDLNVFPNPTHGLSIVKCEGQFDVNLSCQLTITSMEGRVMSNQMVLMKDMVAGFQINASAYAAGTYIVSVAFMNQTYSKKLIKL
jgi:hypothetical protein